VEHEVFEALSAIAREVAGIKLGPGKEALVEARVSKRLRALGIAAPRDYLEYLRADETGREVTAFLDVITTNFTSFFREEDHFRYVRDWIAGPGEAHGGQLRFWCAAAASGEEPYSLAFTLADAMEGDRRGFRILATDISTKALGSARAGEYEEKAVEQVPDEMRVRFMSAGRRHDGARVYSVRPAIRERVVFGRLNLAAPPYPMKGPFHIVFCRNVMIYFDKATAGGLIREIERLLVPGGVLLTGHSDTISGIPTGLRMLRPSVYVKPGRPSMAPRAVA
jgi:chemotaxis protein methyltransferase CheR